MEYYVIQPVAVAPDEWVEATGGLVTDYVDGFGLKWRFHEFTGTDVFSVTSPGLVRCILLGGSGGAGKYGGGGGGGGAGGLLNFGRPVAMHFAAGDHTIQIGAGGVYGGGSNNHGSSGGNTQIGYTLRAYGGGGGGGIHEDSNAGSNGGSGGGGASGEFSWWPTRQPGSGYEGQGHGGGRGGNKYEGKEGGGSGGGAGGPGSDGSGITGIGGDGGPGVEVIVAGEPRIYACGGAGGGEVSRGKDAEGLFGANSGRGGSLAAGTSASGNSGVAILYYRIP